MTDHWSDYINFDADWDMNAPHSAMVIHTLDQIWENSPETDEHSFKELLRNKEGQNHIMLTVDANQLSNASIETQAVTINLLDTLNLAEFSTDGEAFIPNAHRKIIHEIVHAATKESNEQSVIDKTNNILIAAYGDDVILRDPDAYGRVIKVDLDTSQHFTDTIRELLENAHGTFVKDIDGLHNNSTEPKAETLTLS